MKTTFLKYIVLHEKRLHIKESSSSLHHEMPLIFTIQFCEELLIKYKSSLFSTLFWSALSIYENHHKYPPFFHSFSSYFLLSFFLAFSSFFLFLFFVLSFLLSFLSFSLSFLSSSILPCRDSFMHKLAWLG